MPRLSLEHCSGKIGQKPLTAWIAEENLRSLLAVARTGAARHQVGHARWKFLTWCADSDIPEARQLAITIDRWWPEIEAFIRAGHHNAKSVGINRVISSRPATQRTNGYGHVAAPQDEPADTSAPLNLEDPLFLKLPDRANRAQKGLKEGPPAWPS
ncbi:transposase [Streptomyces sp. NBC_00286]|uniref:transposase n=1 Tax=Streptomyces sp. NBC_00286 TaxID=2975701 RepID=UPI002E289BEB|nr:transposase [Streptomyces sp. NBC_00286]